MPFASKYGRPPPNKHGMWVDNNVNEEDNGVIDNVEGVRILY